MGIAWTDPVWRGVAAMLPQLTVSRRLRRISRTTGRPVEWPAAPQILIPGDPDATLTATLSEDQMEAVFALTATQAAAAIRAGVMWHIESGRRVGRITVVSDG